MSTTDQILVGILMGSDTDWPTMKKAADACEEFGIRWEARVMSAHRTPEDVAEYSRTAVQRGLRVVIAGAGGAAHLAGVVESLTMFHVFANPIYTKLAG
jgi:5-(carboxyamino)imidazole ribonucleotide mutase